VKSEDVAQESINFGFWILDFGFVPQINLGA